MEDLSPVKTYKIIEPLCGRICLAFGIMNIMPYCDKTPGHTDDHQTVISFGDGSKYTILWNGPLS